MNLDFLPPDRIKISFTYSVATVCLVKDFPGHKYHPGKEKYWSIPLINSAEALERLTYKGFGMTPALKSALLREQSQALQLSTLAASTDTEYPSELPLYPFQRVGAKWLTTVGSGVLALEQGLGKTVTSLAVCRTGKVLIVCPASLKYQWEAEIHKFIPGAGVQVIDGTVHKRKLQWLKLHNDATRFFITNYENLTRDHQPFRIIWDYLIADESTKIANRKAKMTKQMKQLRADHKIAMTGTPMSNRIENLWSQVDFTNPGSLGSYWQFQQRYCTQDHWGGITGHQNLDELNIRLKRYMLRRTKAEVLPDLPEMIITDVPLKLSDKERTLYDKIKKELLYEVEQMELSKVTNPITLQHTIVKLGKLQELVDSMELLGEETESTKLAALKELLVESSDKVIIFTRYSRMADILMRELADRSPVLIAGRLTPEERQRSVDAFNGDCDTLISTDAGAYGLNLQAGNIVIHFELPWSIAKYEQRNGRAHRIGQERNVMVYHLLAKGTIDMYTRRVLHAKRELAETLLRPMDRTIDVIKEALTYTEPGEN